MYSISIEGFKKGNRRKYLISGHGLDLVIRNTCMLWWISIIFKLTSWTWASQSPFGGFPSPLKIQERPLYQLMPACSWSSLPTSTLLRYCSRQQHPSATMTDKENGRVSSRDLGRATATDIVSTTESDVNRELHFVRRGEALVVASSSQESIDGYDPDLMSGRTLLTAEEEKRLLRKIDWRLMTLCSLIFMFKNLDSNNVRMHTQLLLMVHSNEQLCRPQTLESWTKERIRISWRNLELHPTSTVSWQSSTM